MRNQFRPLGLGKGISQRHEFHKSSRIELVQIGLIRVLLCLGENDSLFQSAKISSQL